MIEQQLALTSLKGCHDPTLEAYLGEEDENSFYLLMPADNLPDELPESVWVWDDLMFDLNKLNMAISRVENRWYLVFLGKLKHCEDD